MLTCSPDRPWGVHPPVRSDEDCPRCGWTAPGPKGDAIEAAAEARSWLAELGWAGKAGMTGEALAA
jgi:hypothetical protein